MSFDTFLGHVRSAATDMFGDDTDEVLDLADRLVGDRGGSGGSGGGFDWGEALSSVLGDRGGGSVGGGEPVDDGWGFLGRMVAELSGGPPEGAGGPGGPGDAGAPDGAGGPAGLLARAAAFLPDEVRGVAGGLLGPEAAPWVGRLVDPTSTEVPDDWGSLGRSLAALGLGLGDADDPVDLTDLTRLTRLALGGDGPGGDGIPGLGIDPLGHLGYAEPSAAAPDVLHAGRYDEPPAPGGPAPDAPGDDVAPPPLDYDELVTSGADPPPEAVAPPYDPTFPADPAPPPTDDFPASIEAADEVERSMDAVFEGPS